MNVGQTVVIEDNPVHPRLAGRVGIVVFVTPAHQTCGITHITNHRQKGRAPKETVRCGQNPIVEVEGEGRFLIPARCVSALEVNS